MIIVTDKTALNQRSQPVSSHEGIQIGNELLEYLEKNCPTGVGLAAPQVGIYKRVFVMKYQRMRHIRVNPVILKRLLPVVVTESCLSFPGQEVQVERCSYIEVQDMVIGDEYRYQNPITILRGMAAIIFQHELDHLDGITILDIGVPNAL